MESQNLSKSQKTILIALVIGLALVVRFYRLGHENFWIDEVYQVRVASQTLSEIVRNYGSEQFEFATRDQAPLSQLIVHFFHIRNEIRIFRPSSIGDL